MDLSASNRTCKSIRYCRGELSFNSRCHQEYYSCCCFNKCSDRRFVNHIIFTHLLNLTFGIWYLGVQSIGITFLTFLSFIGYWLLNGLHLVNNQRLKPLLSYFYCSAITSLTIIYVYVLTHHYGIPCPSTQILYGYKNPVFILVGETQSRCLSA